MANPRKYLCHSFNTGNLEETIFKKVVLGMPLNSIKWWYFHLGSMGCPVTAITPKSTLIQNCISSSRFFYESNRSISKLLVIYWNV